MLGLLGALVMLTALVCNLVLLPALLMLGRADTAMRPAPTRAPTP
jgi:hypothetical protein